MSQETVDLYYRAIEAFNRRGHDGIRRWWEETFTVLPDINVEAHEVRDLGSSLFVHGTLRGHGAESGVPIERPLWQVVERQDRKTVRWRVFESQAEAIEAAELRE